MFLLLHCAVAQYDDDHDEILIAVEPGGEEEDFF